MFKVQKRMCKSCIYRPNSPLDIARLERQIADPKMPGFFQGYRICHHSERACCRGFWNRHKDNFSLGQLAQRLKQVIFVEADAFEMNTVNPRILTFKEAHIVTVQLKTLAQQQPRDWIAAQTCIGRVECFAVPPERALRRWLFEFKLNGVPETQTNIVRQMIGLDVVREANVVNTEIGR